MRHCLINDFYFISGRFTYHWMHRVFKRHSLNYRGIYHLNITFFMKFLISATLSTSYKNTAFAMLSISLYVIASNADFVRDAPLDIWGTGKAYSFCCLQTFFLPPRENNLFFGYQHPPILFFLCVVEEIFCRMLSLLGRFPFGVFSGQHIFHKFQQQTFFSAHIFNKLFFSDFSGDKLFFHFFSRPPPPPPVIKWCVPNHLLFLMCPT